MQPPFSAMPPIEWTVPITIQHEEGPIFRLSDTIVLRNRVMRVNLTLCFEPEFVLVAEDKASQLPTTCGHCADLNWYPLIIR